MSSTLNRLDADTFKLFTPILFTERTMACIPADWANFPSRVMAKALALQMFSRQSDLKEAVATTDPAELASRLRNTFATYLPGEIRQKVVPAVLDWIRSRGLSAPTAESGRVIWDEREQHLADRTDWDWVAALLKRELAEHQHRPGERTFELAVGESLQQWCEREIAQKFANDLTGGLVTDLAYELSIWINDTLTKDGLEAVAVMLAEELPEYLANNLWMDVMVLFPRIVNNALADLAIAQD